MKNEKSCVIKLPKHTVCGTGDCYRNIFWRRRWFTYCKTKKVKLEKEENVNFTVKTIPGDGHYIVNCFSMFIGKDSTEILSLLWNEFQKNIHLYMRSSKYNSTEELFKSLEEYIFNKRYNHDTVDLVFEALSKIFQHRAFIFEESLPNSPRGIIGERYNRFINVLKRGDHYNFIVVNEKGCEKANNRLHHPYSCSILLFYIFFCFIFTTALLKSCWFVFIFPWFT